MQSRSDYTATKAVSIHANICMCSHLLRSSCSWLSLFLLWRALIGPCHFEPLTVVVHWSSAWQICWLQTFKSDRSRLDHLTSKLKFWPERLFFYFSTASPGLHQYCTLAFCLPQPLIITHILHVGKNLRGVMLEPNSAATINVLNS